ncbi:hypothetical protein EVAR_77356_1 [Eumeta japonica]|uniref:Uncharacterized protein n=1 Tax=Eumeta variegata TaxID=151549 RepID=A0A4C1UX38_EUMVA|nr:hypothetical protein EVAR_77356_1 [Eumeta japonica]
MLEDDCEFGIIHRFLDRETSMPSHTKSEKKIVSRQVGRLPTPAGPALTLAAARCQGSHLEGKNYILRSDVVKLPPNAESTGDVATIAAAHLVVQHIVGRGRERSCFCIPVGGCAGGRGRHAGHTDRALGIVQISHDDHKTFHPDNKNEYINEGTNSKHPTPRSERCGSEIERDRRKHRVQRRAGARGTERAPRPARRPRPRPPPAAPHASRPFSKFAIFQFSLYFNRFAMCIGRGPQCLGTSLLNIVYDGGVVEPLKGLGESLMA